MKFLLIWIGLVTGTLFAQKSPGIPLPTEAQLHWQDAELVAVFHYDLHVFDGKVYNQRENRVTPIPDHNLFNPTNLDTDQWIQSVKAMGAKIAIITATHETGFALYQSDVNPYCLKAVKWRDGRGDIVRDFVASCRKYGIMPGIYIGIRWNSFYGVHDFMVEGESNFSQNRQSHYNAMCEGMVDELTSRYGELTIVWFDGGAHGPEQGGPDVLSVFERNQPKAIFYHNLDRADIRWGGSESGTVPYPCWGTYGTPSWFANRGDDVDFRPIKYGDPDGNYFIPAMSDAPLRGFNGGHSWFWEPGHEKYIYPTEELMDMYEHSVGHNSTLILGVTPDPSGKIPDTDVKQMRAFGSEIRNRFGRALAETSGEGDFLELVCPKTHAVGYLIIEEDIKFGERVRGFEIQAKKGDEWMVVYQGTSIGHKHIVKIEVKDVTDFKLHIKESVGISVIKRFAAFEAVPSH